MHVGGVDVLQKSKGKPKGKGKAGKGKNNANPSQPKFEGCCMKHGKWGHKRSQCWSGGDGKGVAGGGSRTTA